MYKQDDFIDAFMNWTKEGEAPDTYWEAVALFILAALSDRKVWFDQGVNLLYPNVFFTLVGPPATRKDGAVAFGEKILRKIEGLSIAPDEITRQKLYMEMEDAIKPLDYGDETFNYMGYNVIATEWDVFLGLKDTEFLKRLIKFYDCKEVFEYKTKHNENNYLPNVFLNMLGCIQPDLMSDIFLPNAIGGGFTSRVVHIVETKQRQGIALPYFDKAKEEKIMQMSRYINKTVGAFHMTEEARRWYVDWYAKSRGVSVVADNKKLQGYVHRKPQHMLKIAMLMNLSRTFGDDLSLTIEDMERGLRWLNKVEVNMAGAFKSFGASTSANVTFAVLEFIKEKGHTTAHEISKHFWLDANYIELERILASLEFQRVIAREQKSNTMYIHYRGRKIR